MKTCIHHNDSGRAAAGCPVCLERELAALRAQSEIDSRTIGKAHAEILALRAALEPFAARADTSSPLRIQFPVERWEVLSLSPSIPFNIKGRWAEDGSPYYMSVPHQLIPAFLALQELAGACEQARAALAAGGEK